MSAVAIFGPEQSIWDKKISKIILAVEIVRPGAALTYEEVCDYLNEGVEASRETPLAALDKTYNSALKVLALNALRWTNTTCRSSEPN